MTVLGMPIGQALQAIVSPIQQAMVAERLRELTPTAPDFRKLNPQGMPGEGPGGRFRNLPTGPTVQQELGLTTWPGQAGPDFVSQAHLTDIARDFKDQKERRSLEERALGDFTRSFDAGMARYKGTVDEQFGSALGEGTQSFGDAIANVQSQYGNADAALTATIKSLSQGLKDVHDMRVNTLKEMETAKGEYMEQLVEDNAALVGQQVVQMDGRGRMEYEELAGELAASGLPMFQQQNLKHKFRLGISRDIGDTVKTLQLEHSKWRNDKELEWDTQINTFRTNFTLKAADISYGTAQEMGGAFGRWADSKQRTAFAEADIRKGHAEWRSSIATNWSMVEGQIRAHDFAGRTVIAEQMRALTIPTYRLGILADAQLAYQNNEAQVKWQNDLALFGIQSGIDTFELQGWNNAFSSVADWQAAHEAESRADDRASEANKYGLGSGLFGAAGAVGAGLAIASNPTQKLLDSYKPVTGVPAESLGFSSGSSPTIKKKAVKLDHQKVLRKVESLAVSEWRYKDDAVSVGTITGGKHLGPMADEFAELFGLGDNNEVINYVDALGVCLSAIKALAVRIHTLESENSSATRT